MNSTYPIVDIHASWIALNPIEGCPFSCKYCFMNGTHLTKTMPKILCSEKEAVQKLLESKLYTNNMPICLFTETDVFALKSSIEYARNILKLLHDSKINNPIVLITKCEIPDDFIEMIDNYEKDGMIFIILLSYSGLDNEIEVGINHNKIKDNFIKLHNRNKKVIHYWRPFLPQNSTDEKIDMVYNFVKQYAYGSIIVGLKVQEKTIDNFSFWPEVKLNKKKAISSECVWTKNVYDRLYNYKADDYRIFRSTSCAIASCLNVSDYNCFYGSKICELNNCSKCQNDICSKNADKNVNINDAIMRFKEKFSMEFDYTFDNENRIIFINKSLLTSEIVYLKYLTNCKIECPKNSKDYYWSSSNFEKENLII